MLQYGLADFSMEASAAPEEFKDRSRSLLSDVLGWLGAWLKTCKGPPYPVIIMHCCQLRSADSGHGSLYKPVLCHFLALTHADEANKLRNWEDKDALRVLLGFLVYTSKEKGLCHVVLSTWDSFFSIWLQNCGICLGQFQRIELGDLAENDIKTFVYGNGDGDQGSWQGQIELAKMDPAEEKDFTLPSELWQEAYQLLGGNISEWKVAIRKAAGEFTLHGMKDLLASWRLVFEEQRMEATRFVQQPFDPSILAPIADECACWTPQQYGEVLQMIADAPEPHVVPYNAVSAKIGGKALKSLLSYNYLSLRTKSAIARDLPPEIFKKGEDVITACNQAALNYIKTKEWQDWVPACSDTNHSPSPSRSSSPTRDRIRAVADSIAAVAVKIEVIKGQMKAASDKVADIMAAQGEGWQSNLAHWQQKEQRLVEKRRQLLVLVSQLQEEKALLMKRCC